MATHTDAPAEFISYPHQRVVGTIAEASAARAAIEALLKHGFMRSDIEVLRGEHDLPRLDPSGAEHGFFAQFQRSVMKTLGPAEEFRSLSRHVEDLRAGRFVVMVLAEQREQRNLAADILNSHGATFVAFYGRWTLEAMGPDAVTAPASTSSQDPSAQPVALTDTYKAAVTAFYDLAVNQMRPDEAVRRYVGAAYREYDPTIGDGKDALVAHFERMTREHPGMHVEFKRVLAETPFVVLHCVQRRPNDGDWVAIDIVRVDEAGQIVEHWAATQRVPARSANANPLF